MLWFDLLSNHSSSGTGAKEQTMDRRHNLAATFFKNYYFYFILLYLAKISLLVPCPQFLHSLAIKRLWLVLGWFFLTFPTTWDINCLSKKKN